MTEKQTNRKESIEEMLPKKKLLAQQWIDIVWYVVSYVFYRLNLIMVAYISRHDTEQPWAFLESMSEPWKHPNYYYLEQTP